MQKKTILAIDDTAMQLHALIKILQPIYSVKVAKDGETGLEFAQKSNIDLIFLDMVMPGMSGLEVLEALKASDKTKNIPVILATGSTSAENQQKGFDLGAACYIQKPFEQEKVMQSINQVLGYTNPHLKPR